MGIFQKIQTHNHKFEDFQKSEMIQEVSVDFGIEYKVTAIQRNGKLLILKQEQVKLY